MDEAIVLARQAGGGLIDDDEAIAIAERTGGNPFFIVETTGMLLPESDGAPRTSHGTLPPTVQAVVTARLDALPPRLRSSPAAHRSSRYSFDLEELLSVDADVTIEELHQLAGSRDRGPPGGRRHPVLADASLDAPRRRVREPAEA